MVDQRNRKIKAKFDCNLYSVMLDKEQQRTKEENTFLAKQQSRIDDKQLIKLLQKVCKKLLRPFRGLQFDDYLHNEIHLNEIMARSDDVIETIKESRKRHLRILDAALREQVVDTQLSLGICI